MLSAIPDFLQTIFSDSLSKFFQPTYLVVAFTFTFLNLTFIFPLLAALKIPFVLALLSLNPLLQSLLISLTVLVTGYLLLSLNNFVLKFLTGELWNSSLLGSLLIRRQKAEKDRLTKLSGGPDARGLIARLDKLTRFPDEDENIGPTALGNVLSATASYIWSHYGIDMTALWPHMEKAVSGDDNLATRLTNEKSTLDFLVNLTFVLLAFAVELVFVQFFGRQGANILWALLPLGLAFVVYRAAVSQARTWGDVVEMAFDLHRPDLKQALQLRDFVSVEDERQVWMKVSRWLLWGDYAQDVFAAQPTFAPTVTSSANSKVDLQYATIDVAYPNGEPCSYPQDGQTMSGIRRVYQKTHYTFTVSSDAMGLAPQNVYVLISHAKVPMIDAVPSLDVQDPKYDGRIIRTNDADQLLWTTANNTPGSIAAISYELPSCMFRATTATPGLSITAEETRSTDTGAIDYTITLENRGTAPTQDAIIIDVFESRRILPETPKFGCIWRGDNGTPAIVQAQKVSKWVPYSWKIDARLEPKERVTLRYTL